MLKKITNAVLLVFVFSLPFVGFLYVTVLERKVLISEFVFLALGLFFLLTLVLRQNKLKMSWFYLPLGVYAVALSISTIFSDEPKKSAIKLVGELYLIGIAALVFNLTSTLKDLKRISIAWLIATGVVCIVSLATLVAFYADRSNIILQYTLSHYGTLPVGNYPRIQGSFLNPNMLCHYLSIGWILLLTAYYNRWINRWIFFILATLFVIAAAFTISPGIGAFFLGTGLWLSYFFRKENRPTWSKWSLGIGLAAATLFFVAVTIYPVRSDSGNLTVRPSIRVAAWENSLRTFAQNPLVGKGLEANVARTNWVLPSGRGIYITDAHQMWLNVAGQAGFIGLAAIIFLGLWILGIGKPFGFEDRTSAIRTGLMIAFVSGFFYQGLFGSYENARHLWALIGLLGVFSSSRFLAEE